MATKGYFLTTLYQNQNIKAGTIMWTGSATTSGGVATFFPTDDNTGDGNALFANIYSIQVSASANTAIATSVPIASVKLLAADKKSLTVNAINGVILAVFGATTEFSADGTTIYCTIIGD